MSSHLPIRVDSRRRRDSDWPSPHCNIHTLGLVWFYISIYQLQIASALRVHVLFYKDPESRFVNFAFCPCSDEASESVPFHQPVRAFTSTCKVPFRGWNLLETCHNCDHGPCQCWQMALQDHQHGHQFLQKNKLFVRSSSVILGISLNHFYSFFAAQMTGRKSWHLMSGAAFSMKGFLPLPAWQNGHS